MNFFIMEKRTSMVLTSGGCFFASFRPISAISRQPLEIPAITPRNLAAVASNRRIPAMSRQRPAGGRELDPARRLAVRHAAHALMVSNALLFLKLFVTMMQRSWNSRANPGNFGPESALSC